MRNRYIVCYDISNPKRLAKVYKKMRGFGDPAQDRVFKCDLSLQEKMLLITSLNELINHKEDRIMIINVGPTNGQADNAFEFMGRSIEFSTPAAKII